MKAGIGDSAPYLPMWLPVLVLEPFAHLTGELETLTALSVRLSCNYYTLTVLRVLQRKDVLKKIEGFPIPSNVTITFEPGTVAPVAEQLLFLFPF